MTLRLHKNELFLASCFGIISLLITHYVGALPGLVSVVAYFYIVILGRINNFYSGKSIRKAPSILEATFILLAIIGLVANQVILLVPLLSIQLVFIYKHVFSRIRRRGPYIALEAFLDVAYLMLLGHFVWILAYLAEIAFLGFDSLYELLTAIHFAFAGFILPICLVGTTMDLTIAGSWRKLASICFIAYLLGFFTVALGIYLNPSLEVFGALTMAISGSLIFVTIGRHLNQKKTLFQWYAITAIFFVTSIFMSSYSLRSVWPPFLKLNEMIYFHGFVNAFVLCPALLLFLSNRKKTFSFDYTAPPLSQIVGWKKISEGFIKALKDDSKVVCGLTDSFESFNGDDFVATSVDPLIRKFYENIEAFNMDVSMKWSFPFSIGSGLYRRFSRNAQQFNFPSSPSMQALKSLIIGIKDEEDGRSGVRAWVRSYVDSGEFIYFALYSQHSGHGRTYMNIAFPWLKSQLTSILFLKNYDESGVRLSTVNDRLKPGYEGIYIKTSKFWFRVPMNENIDVWRSEETIVGRHVVWIFGIPLLKLSYLIKERN